VVARAYAMCYYARTDFRCGDWKWGNMKERCPRQPRIGETCGAKLVAHESLETVQDDCRTCSEIAVKQRRFQKERDNVQRWKREGNKFQASIERAQREMQQLRDVILELNSKRTSVLFSKGQGQYRSQHAVSATPVAPSRR
jgi:hypothetical protein